MEIALERCVGDVEGFFRDHWGAVPLLREPNRAGGPFDDLASLDDLDHMISSLGLSSTRLRLVKDGRSLAPQSYTMSPRSRAGRGEAFVDPASVFELFSQGATIVIEALHRYWRPLTEFCRALELSLGHRTQVNAYVTPPGSRGFDVHRDDHDVFVVQISGAKHWTVHDRTDGDTVLIDAEMQPGAVLYIPTGFPHAAAAQRTISAHLTIGVLTHSSADVLREVVGMAEDEPIFQERLSAATSDPEALKKLVARHVEEMRSWLAKVDVDDLTERVARRLVSTSQPILRGQLRQLDLLPALDERTAVRRRWGTTCLLFPRATALKVLLSDRELEMPLAALGAMEHISSADRFNASDLHGYLDPVSALVLVRRLIKEGLLEVDV